MKRALLLASFAACLPLYAADSNPTTQLTDAAKALGEKPNYSWRTTVAVPEGSRFRPGPTDGKTEKSGLTHLIMHFGENTTEIVLKGEKGAVSTRDDGWQSLSQLENSEGPRRFLALLVRNFKTPSAQAAQLASFAKDLKEDEPGVYSGELTEKGAKELLTWRPAGGGEGPEVSNAQGSAKFWLKDGALTKYEFKLKGTISFNGNDFDSERTTTVEIKNVGATTVNVPEEAKKKLS